MLCPADRSRSASESLHYAPIAPSIPSRSRIPSCSFDFHIRFLHYRPFPQRSNPETKSFLNLLSIERPPHLRQNSYFPPPHLLFRLRIYTYTPTTTKLLRRNRHRVFLLLLPRLLNLRNLKYPSISIEIRIICLRYHHHHHHYCFFPTPSFIVGYPRLCGGGELQRRRLLGSSINYFYLVPLYIFFEPIVYIQVLQRSGLPWTGNFILSRMDPWGGHSAKD